MPGSEPGRGQTRRYGGVDDDSSAATASELESLEDPAPRAPAAGPWRRYALALGATLVAAALLRARLQSAHVGFQVATVELAESPEDCHVQTVGGRPYHVCRDRGCNNWKSLKLTPKATEVADAESCLDLCSKNALCHAANYQTDSSTGSKGVKVGACQLFKDGCDFGHNDFWDYYLPISSGAGAAVARMTEMDPNAPSSTLEHAARRDDRTLNVRDQEKFHKGDWIIIVNQAVVPFESEEAQVESTDPLTLDRRIRGPIYPRGSLVSVVPPIVPTTAPTPEPTVQPTPEPTPEPTTPVPTPAPTALRAVITELSQTANVGVQNLYVNNPGGFREGDMVEVSSTSFRDYCNITGVNLQTLTCKSGIKHAYAAGSPVVLLPEGGTPDAEQPVTGGTIGELLVGHAKLTSNHKAGSVHLFLDSNADFPDNCIIALVNPSMQMVGRHLVKPGGHSERTCEITPALVREWPKDTVAAVVSSFTSATYLEADAEVAIDDTLLLKVAAAAVFDVHDVVMVGSDDHAYAERRKIIKSLRNQTGEYLLLGPREDRSTTYSTMFKAGQYITNAQAQTTLIAPAEKHQKYLHVDTKMFIEAGNEVLIDTGIVSEKAVVKELSSDDKMIVLEKGLNHNYPAGTAVITMPKEQEG